MGRRMLFSLGKQEKRGAGGDALMEAILVSMLIPVIVFLAIEKHGSTSTPWAVKEWSKNLSIFQGV